MAHYRLVLEGHANVFPASLEVVQQAVAQLAGAEGPTFITLTDENENWAQAGGTEGRYLVESRHVYGEGFSHVIAARRDCPDRSKTIVYYRNVCTEGKHPHRKCPLHATVANVVSLDDVLAIITEFWLTGELSARFNWDDHTSRWLADAVKKAGDGIQEIRPNKATES